MDVCSFVSLELGKEEATPIVAEEVLPSIPKDPSPTLIVAGLMSTLEPKKEVVESEQGEDGDESSNMSVDVGEDGDQNIIQKKTNLRKFLKRVKRVSRRQGKARRKWRHKLSSLHQQFNSKLTLQVSYQALPMAINVTEPSSSCYYGNYVTRRSDETPSSNQFNYDNHPFFTDLLDILEELKIFFTKILVNEGDIFETCSISRVPAKKTLSEEMCSPEISSEENIRY